MAPRQLLADLERLPAAELSAETGRLRPTRAVPLDPGPLAVGAGRLVPDPPGAGRRFRSVVRHRGLASAIANSSSSNRPYPAPRTFVTAVAKHGRRAVTRSELVGPPPSDVRITTHGN